MLCNISPITYKCTRCNTSYPWQKKLRTDVHKIKAVCKTKEERLAIPISKYKCGTALTKIFEDINIHPNNKKCNCYLLSTIMDIRGPEWCMSHLDDLCDHIKVNAYKMKIPYSYSGCKRIIELAIDIAKGEVDGLSLLEKASIISRRKIIKTIGSFIDSRAN